MQLKDFESLVHAAEYIEILIDEGELKEARILVKEYEDHCAKGSNDIKQWSIHR